MDLKIQSQMISQNKRRYRNSFVEAGALFVVAALIIIFVVRPKFQQDRAKATELKQAQDQFQSVEADKNTMKELVAKLKSSESDVALVDQALPLQGRATYLDLLLENLVNNSGMKLASIQSDEGASGIIAGDKKLADDPYSAVRKLQTISATVTLTGPVEQFNQFLKLLETSPRLIDVDSVNISRGEEGTSEVLYKVHLKGYFYAPEYEKPGAAGAAGAAGTTAPPSTTAPTAPVPLPTQSTPPKP